MYIILSQVIIIHLVASLFLFCIQLLNTSNVPMESDRKRRSNELRVQSMEDRLKRMKDSKSLISDSLSGKYIPESNHITFEMDSDDDVIHNNHTRNDIFGDNNNESDTETYTLPDKPQFEGETGAKLFKLQQQTRNDYRFRLDSRFGEDEIPESDSEKKGDNFVDEKQKNLQILGDVLGKDIRAYRPLREIRNRVRFDPTLDSHKKYIIQKEDREDNPVSKSTGTSLNYVTADAVEMPKVNKQTYYEYQDTSESIARLFEPSLSNDNPEPGIFNFDIQEPEPSVLSQPYTFDHKQEDSTLTDLIDTEQHFRTDRHTESDQVTAEISESETRNLFFFHTTDSKLRNRIDDVKFCRQQDVLTLQKEWRDKAASLMRDCKRKHRDAVRWKRKSVSTS